MIADRNKVYGNVLTNSEAMDGFTALARKIVSPLPIQFTEDEHNVVAFLHLAGMQLGSYGWHNSDASPGFKDMVGEYLEILSRYLKQVPPCEEE